MPPPSLRTLGFARYVTQYIVFRSRLRMIARSIENVLGWQHP